MRYLLIIFIFLFFSCTVTKTNYQADTSIVVQVDSDNYEIVGDIKGSAIGNIILFGYIPIPFGDNGRYGRVQSNLWRSHSKGYVYDMAMYNAIQDANRKYPGGVDAIITPKYTSYVSGFPPFWWRWEVEIEGKGIRLITTDSSDSKTKKSFEREF